MEATFMIITVLLIAFSIFCSIPTEEEERRRKAREYQDYLR